MPPGDTVADPPGVGETLADGDVLGAGDELAVAVPVGDAVGEADGDMAAGGLEVGAAPADAASRPTTSEAIVSGRASCR